MPKAMRAAHHVSRNMITTETAAPKSAAHLL